MKKHTARPAFVFAVTLLLAALLVGCGSKTVSEDQILRDLRESGELQNCFCSQYVPDLPFEVTDCEIRKERHGKDTVICDVRMSNEYFDVTLDAELDYRRSGGSRVLDGVSYSVADVCARKAPEPSFLESTIRDCTSEEFSCSTPYRVIYFDNDHQSLAIFGTELSGDKNALVHCCHEAPDGAEYYGDYKMSLELDGWQFPAMYYNGHKTVMYMEMTDSTQDYSKAIGTFYDPWENGYLTVSSIENGVVTYSLHSDSQILKNNEFEQGDNLTAPFDSKFGAFQEIIYMPREDEWVFGGVTFERAAK